MFDERMALKIRLDQLADAEVRVIEEFKKEREAIFARLQELDQEETLHLPLQEVPAVERPVVQRSRRGRKSDSLDEMRSTTIRILKQQNTPIRGVELKKYIEEESGRKIANMTTFMASLERENDRVRKLGRGLYMYHYE